MSSFLRLLSAVSSAALVFVSTGASGFAVPRSSSVSFTNPVTITAFGSPNYRIGVAAGEISIHATPASIPVVTLVNEGLAEDNARWAIELLSDGNYFMHVVGFNGAVNNGSVYAEAPILNEPQEVVIMAYDNNNTFTIGPAGQTGAWTIDENVGDQLTIQPFDAHSSQLFQIVSVTA